MARNVFLFLLVLLPVAGFGTGFPIFGKAPNKYKNARKHGRWVTYHDEGKAIKMTQGRYKNGTEKGTWRYYNEQGQPVKKERYRRDRIFTTKYHPNGRIYCAGVAVLEETDQFAEYFYQGSWKYYTVSGHLHKIVRYERGEEAETQYY